MEKNKLEVLINKPPSEVFAFTITPPNSILWIPSVVGEETNEFPIRVGTVYRLKDVSGKYSEVTVFAIEENKLVEWISEDKNYHCRYSFKTKGDNDTNFKYEEWVDSGELVEPFTIEILGRLKNVLEART